MFARMLSGIRFFALWRCFTIASVNHEINEEILDKEIRVIGDDGEQLGIMSAEAAMKIDRKSVV